MKTYMMTAVLLAGAWVLAGCAGAGKADPTRVTGIRCADCKTLTSTDLVNNGKRTETVRRTSHTCKGCKGEVETLFTEGKWQHKCTKCAGAPCDHCDAQ